MLHSGLSLEDAASSVIHGTLSEMGGDGGVIGLDRHGNVTMTFNTDGMYRGYVDAAGNTHVAMFGK
jgi:beta-aspartyl-peptidase (threonine type)